MRSPTLAKFDLPRVAITAAVVVFVSLAVSSVAHAASVDFQKQIAPLLTEHCVACHNRSQLKGGLDLSTGATVLKGGQSGAALVPGKPRESYLLDMVSSTDGARPQMPAKGAPLTTAQVALIEQWIVEGAAWPEGLMLREPAKADRNWWSLQPLAIVEPPANQGAPAGWNDSPIDRFIFAKLATQNLTPNPPAERRALIRRVTYDVLGLPPTPEEVDAFDNDKRPDAYERLIDRLLASPHYGEQWGRHWLDVVRFGESIGFERNLITDNAWPFRDYVIKSFNDDKPFDRLILEHLAGDVIGKDQPAVEVGTTFLVAGAYDNVGNSDPIQAAQIRANTLDDIVRATGEAFLGLTIGCARCHDHKFDPIRQEDYYSMYATFAGVKHGERSVATAEARQARDSQVKPLEAERQRVAAAKEALEKSLLDRAKAHLADYEKQWTRPAPVYSLIEEPVAPVEARYVRLVVDEVQGIARNMSLASSYAIDEFEVFDLSEPAVNVALATNGAQAEGESRKIEDFAEAYSAKLAIDGKYQSPFTAIKPELTITLAQPTKINRVVFSSNRNGDYSRPFPIEYRIEVSLDKHEWTEVASSRDRRPVKAAYDRRLIKLEASDAEQAQLAALTRDLQAADAALAKIAPLPSWWAGIFSEAKGPFQVFLGGDPQKPGPATPIGHLQSISANGPTYRVDDASPESVRRLALAEWLGDKRNPLTPRVLANRVWQYHFGTGIVDSASDFGYLGSRPTHPELLDWLAGRLLAHGWRMKPLHREILLSQTYRQSSAWREAAARVDASSRSLWRYPPRRMAAEELRDTFLTVAGKLDTKPGGPGFRLYRYLIDNVATYVPLDAPGPETYRRAVYHQNARASRVDLLSDYDCPDGALATPVRANTTSPLQALTMLNHRFTLDMAGALAARLERDTGSDDPAAQVDRAWLLAFARHPANDELQASVAMIRQRGLAAFCRALLNTNELIYLD
ncbi:MAG: DUF1553 domain-containing protein [Planctomycetes bacterium]|nr:DUF1553 domain-containing protein [Planctomycetota bacterium]